MVCVCVCVGGGGGAANTWCTGALTSRGRVGGGASSASQVSQAGAASAQSPMHPRLCPSPTCTQASTMHRPAYGGGHGSRVPWAQTHNTHTHTPPVRVKGHRKGGYCSPEKDPLARTGVRVSRCLLSMRSRAGGATGELGARMAEGGGGGGMTAADRGAPAAAQSQVETWGWGERDTRVTRANSKDAGPPPTPMTPGKTHMPHPSHSPPHRDKQQQQRHRVGVGDGGRGKMTRQRHWVVASHRSGDARGWC
jgi:hypothetical protein